MATIGSVILAIGIIGNYYFFDFIEAKNTYGERVSLVSATHIIFDTLVFVGLLVLAFIIAIHYNKIRWPQYS